MLFIPCEITPFFLQIKNIENSDISVAVAVAVSTIQQCLTKKCDLLTFVFFNDIWRFE